MPFYSEITIYDKEQEETILVDVYTNFEPADPSVGYMTSSHTIEDVCYSNTNESVPGSVWEGQAEDIMKEVDRRDESKREEVAIAWFEDRQDMENYRATRYYP